VPRFVIQEHYARSHHFDLRLERNGALVSWAVPKGMPVDPKSNRLAIRVEDHALSHLDYTDDTPVGDGDAVRVRIWDEGAYTSHEFGDDMVVVTFHGRRITGQYAIFRTRDKNWLVHRMDPAPEPSE
jgi:bifunctional non-homologous end joining protein LigD